MRRRLAWIVRRPVAWLLLLLLSAWGWYFHWEVTPTPTRVVETGANHEVEYGVMNGGSTWGSVLHVSDDGIEVTIGVNYGNRHGVETKPFLWNTISKTDRTPPHWLREDWKGYYSRGIGQGPGSLLAVTIQNREGLPTDVEWTKLRERMKQYRVKAIDDLARTIRPDLLNPRPLAPNEEEPNPFPQSLSFSPDGQWVSYVSRNGYPVYEVSEKLGDGVVIEELLSGKRIAFFPRVEYLSGLSSRGQFAVSRTFPEVREGDEPRLLLWSVETSTRIGELRLPDDFGSLSYSPNERLVFAEYSIWGKPGGPHLRWWNAATGEQLGNVDNAPDWLLMGKAKLVVTHPWREHKQGGITESYRLQFWDANSGGNRGEWKLGIQKYRAGRLSDFVGSDSDRYIVATYDPDYGVGRSPAGRIGDRFQRSFTGDEHPERECTLLLDVIERQQVARLPGSEAAYSRDGRWLATIDKKGILRVWELPLHWPWGTILGYTFVASLGSWILLIVAWRLLRLCGAPRLVKGSYRWATGNRSRTKWAIGLLGCTVITLGTLTWYSFALSNAQREMEDAYEQISWDDTLESVTAVIGKPAIDGPSTGIDGPFKGGGQTGIPVTKRKWSRMGTEIEVAFGEDGLVKASYMSYEQGIFTRLVDWLGW